MDGSLEETEETENRQQNSDADVSSEDKIMDYKRESGFTPLLLRYCRNVRPTWVKFNSKDTKESEWCSRF